MSFVLNQLWPKLVELMQSGLLPVKIGCCKLACEIFKRITSDENKLAFSELIVEKFAKSRRSFDRVLYIDFCLLTRNVISKHMFKIHFLDSLMVLCKDQLIDVRFKFVSEFPGIRERISATDIQSSHEIDQIFDDFHKDSSTRISEMCVDVQSHIINEEY